MNPHQDLADIFTIFHDGYIDFYSRNLNNLSLKIECQYIAHLIEKDFTFFILELKDLELIKYETWSENAFNGKSMEQVLDLGIEILEGSISESNQLNIATFCDHEQFVGGNLFLTCSQYELFDENRKSITLDKLKALSHHYWHNIFGKK